MKQDSTFKAGVIGATGYAGYELVRLLLAHPNAELAGVSSVSYTGQRLDAVYPQLAGFCGLVLGEQDDVVDSCDVVFACLPAGLSEKAARRCYDAGKLFIDMGADFRLKSEADYEGWYGGKFGDKQLHREAVYSVPELHRQRIMGQGVRIIANPGCYPTSVLLGLAPAVRSKAIRMDTLIIDSKSGATGAGRALTLSSHFAECNETCAPYKIASHRHTPEIEQELSELYAARVTVTFTPHLIPMNRGIESTMYATLGDGVDLKRVVSLYQSFYEDEAFVKVLPQGAVAGTKNVRGSNMCHISLHCDKRTNRLIIVSVIDNMVKGAAGQAIQNMNLALDLPETTGLVAAPTAF